MRSAHLTLSIYYCSVCFCRFKRIFLQENTYCIAGTARWADLSARHHIKTSPKGSGLMWWLVLRWAHLAFPTMPYAYILALMLLDFTTRCMVRSVHLALSPIRFTAQFHFTVSDRYSTKNCILHRWYSEMCWSEISPYRRTNDAVCIYSRTNAVGFTTKRMVRSAHLTLSYTPSLFIFILPFQTDIRTKKYILHH